MQNERIHWIDIAKGIGIIFIIYAHELGSHDLRYLFYSFHIPLFLFLSGIVFKPYSNFFKFLKKCVNGLLIPYLLIAFASYVIWAINFTNFSFTGNEEIKQFLSIFYGNSNNGLMDFNNILWFLPTLFITRIMFYFLHKFVTKTSKLVLSLFLISIIGYVYSIYVNLKLPFGTETAISALVFYGSGYLWFNNEKAKTVIYNFRKILFPSLLIIGIIISTIEFNNYGQQIDMRLLHLNNYFSFYFDAYAGIIAWISFSLILNKNNILEYLGKNSLVLFSWHFILFNYFDKFRDIFFSKNFIQSIKIILPTLYAASSILIILSINNLYYKLLFKMFPKPQTK